MADSLDRRALVRIVIAAGRGLEHTRSEVREAVAAADAAFEQFVSGRHDVAAPDVLNGYHRALKLIDARTGAPRARSATRERGLRD